MPHVTRRWLAGLLFALSLSTVAFAQAQTAADTSAADEAALGRLAAEYYSAYAREDADGLARLWSQQSPELAAARRRALEQFAALDRIEAKGVRVTKLSVTGARAKLRVEVEMSAVDAKTGKAATGFGQMRRVLECVNEDGAWKVWRERSAYDELAADLLAAKSEAERAALLDGNKELVSLDLIAALDTPGDRLVLRGDYAAAVRHYELGMEVARRLGDREAEAAMLGSIGDAHRAQGYYDAALDHFHRSLKLREAIGSKPGAAVVYNNLGVVHRLLGNLEQALEYYNQSLRLKYELGEQADPRGIAATLSNLGVVYARLGNYALALEHYQKALPLREAAGDKAGVANTLNNIGTLHSNQRNPALALEYHRRSLALSEESGDRAGIALSLSNMAKPLGDLGRYDEMLASAQQALRLAEESKNRQRTIEALTNIGAAHRMTGRYELALEVLQRGVQLAEAAGAQAELLFMLNHVSAIYEVQGRPAQMLESARRTAEIARRANESSQLMPALYRVGLAHAALGRPAEAQAAFEQAIAVVEGMRGQVAGGAQEQQQFFADKVAPYHQMVLLLAAQGKVGEALTYAERAKSRALLDVFSGAQANVTKAMTAEEREREQRLNNALVQLNAQLAREKLRPQPDERRIAELNAKLRRARLDLEEFSSTLYAAHPELRTQRGGAQIIKPEEAARLLPDMRAALLEYAVTADRTLLFVLTRAAGSPQAVEIKAYPIDLKAADLAKRTAAFRGQLAARDPDFRGAARELYDLLLKPAARELRGKTYLTIVPDGALWELPFQALQGAANRYLIEDAAVAYAPSLTVLREMTKSERPRPNGSARPPVTLLAFGNPSLGPAAVERAKVVLMGEKLEPLPEAEQQVKALARIYGPAHSRVYVGAEAREERAKGEAGRARILHLATHGVLNDASPMYSHVLLAQEGEGREDGLLEAWELMKLELNADLVVLSACETARGRVSAGEGVIGLAWALFVAGCPRTVVSQWKVEAASTADLMVEFHRRLKAQNPKLDGASGAAQALRAAAVKMLGGTEYRHPFWWAGFVVVGDGN
jgi:CHAT domain-containing protein